MGDAYAQSKLAVVLHTLQLAKRLEGDNVALFLDRIDYVGPSISSFLETKYLLNSVETKLKL